jgi:hypothetical protein
VQVLWSSTHKAGIPNAIEEFSAGDLMKQVTQSERLDLLDALIYGDVFDCAVTFDELWRYARIAVGREQLRQLVRDDPVLRRLVVERDGFYCLEERDSLLCERPQRILRARRLQKRARFLAGILRHLPFVRGLLLTGSTSADDATKEADIDLLVIVADGRIGTVFLQLAPAASLLGGRLFCPNWYMSEDHLGIASKNLYIAREFAQASSLCGNTEALYNSNPWISEVFPNAAVPPPVEAHLKRRSSIQRCLEAVFRKAFGRRLEDWAKRLVRARLKAHYTRFNMQVPSQVSANFEAGAVLGFHGYRYEAKTLQAHAHRRARFKGKLTSALRSVAGTGRIKPDE